jgi:hypothetical protein
MAIITLALFWLALGYVYLQSVSPVNPDGIPGIHSENHSGNARLIYGPFVGYASLIPLGGGK